MNDLSHQSTPPNGTPVTAEGTTSGKRRAEDRLNIPSSIVRNSGFAPGDKAFVMDEDPTGAVPKPCLVLLKEQPLKMLADYAVTKDCRIRVAPAMLKRAGLKGNTFEFDAFDGRIVVRPRKESAGPPF